MSVEAVAIVAVGVGILAVLVPLMVTLHGRTDRRIDALASDMAEVRRDVHALAERVARGRHDRPLAAAGERHPGTSGTSGRHAAGIGHRVIRAPAVAQPNFASGTIWTGQRPERCALGVDAGSVASVVATDDLGDEGARAAQQRGLFDGAFEVAVGAL